MNAYQERDNTLQKIGFASYKDYLESDLWQRIRTIVMRAAQGRCRACGKQAHEVHHSSYAEAVLRGDNFDALHAVCAPCHERAEVGPDGKKRGLSEANRLLGIGFSPVAKPQILASPKKKPKKHRKLSKAERTVQSMAKQRCKPGHCTVCGNNLTKFGTCRPCSKKQSFKAEVKKLREADLRDLRKKKKYRFPNPPGDFNLSRALEGQSKKYKRIDTIGSSEQAPAQAAAESASLPLTDNQGPCVVLRDTGSQNSGVPGVVGKSIKLKKKTKLRLVQLWKYSSR